MPAPLAQYISEWQWRASVVAAFGGMPTKILTGSKTYDPPSIANAAASPATTITVTGAVVGYRCMAGFSLDLQGLHPNAWVSAADTVSVNLLNLTGGALDLGSGTLSVDVWVP